MAETDNPDSDGQNTENGERRVERRGVPMDVMTDSEIYRASTGSYQHGLPGMTLTLNLEAAGEVTYENLRDELDAMFDELYEHALEELEGDSDSVRETPIPSSETDRVGGVRFCGVSGLYVRIVTDGEEWKEIFEFQESELVERGSGDVLERSETPVVQRIGKYEYVSDGKIVVESKHGDKDAVWYDTYEFEMAKRLGAADGD